MQLKDLLTVGPADGSPGPITRCVAGAVLAQSLLVAAQQLPELLGVWQKEGSRVRDAQEQDGEEREPGHGSAGHSDTSTVWIGFSDCGRQRGVSERPSSESQTHNLQGGNIQ